MIPRLLIAQSAMTPKHSGGARLKEMRTLRRRVESGAAAADTTCCSAAGAAAAALKAAAFLRPNVFIVFPTFAWDDAFTLADLLLWGIDFPGCAPLGNVR